MTSEDARHDTALKRVALELREGDGMSYGEIAVRLPRDRAWVEEVLSDA